MNFEEKRKMLMQMASEIAKHCTDKPPGHAAQYAVEVATGIWNRTEGYLEAQLEEPVEEDTCISLANIHRR